MSEKTANIRVHCEKCGKEVRATLHSINHEYGHNTIQYRLDGECGHRITKTYSKTDS